MSLTGLYFLDW